MKADFLTRAMSEHGEPSARRVVMVYGLLIFAPLMLLACLRWQSSVFGECFVAWAAICGGVYVGGSFASRGSAPAAGPPSATP